MEKTNELRRVTGLWRTEGGKELTATDDNVVFRVLINRNRQRKDQPEFFLYARDKELSGLWRLDSDRRFGGTKNGVRYLVSPNPSKGGNHHPDYILFKGDELHAEENVRGDQSSVAPDDEPDSWCDDFMEDQFGLMQEDEDEFGLSSDEWQLS